jgi:hypothetical protein
LEEGKIYRRDDYAYKLITAKEASMQTWREKETRLYPIHVPFWP